MSQNPSNDPVEVRGKTLLIVRKAPFGNLDSWEALRLALSFYASDSPVDILFEGPGVLNWKSGIEKESQNPDSVSRLVEDVAKFGIPVYLVEEDLQSYGLDRDNLVTNSPKLISREEAAKMIFRHETTMAV